LSLIPSIRRSLLAWFAKPSAAYGWCRTRGSGLAWSREARRGVRVSVETVRRWWQRLGWRWKRAGLVAKDNDPQRATKLAAIRFAVETLRPRQALLLVDELDMARLPQTGYPWMRKGMPVEVHTSGQNEKQYRAGGWDRRAGVVHSCFVERQTNALFRDLLDILPIRSPSQRYDWVYLRADHDRIHKTKRFSSGWRLLLASRCGGCPLTAREPPSERIFGDTHDQVTRHRKRKRLRDWVAEVGRPLDRQGPGPYPLSHLDQKPEIRAALETL
jgi:hypothetical protein